MRICRTCHIPKELTEFQKKLDRKDGLASRCKSCTKEYHTNWRKSNQSRVKAAHQKSRTKLKNDILTAYGRMCACCGETIEQFLTIDHVHNDGAKHRIETNHHVFVDIRKNNFPPKYQLLCWNCNCGRQSNGGICPHQLERGLLIAP